MRYYYEYEWVVETLDKYGDIIHVEHSPLDQFPGLPDTTHDVALRRTNGEMSQDGKDMGGDYSYAYVDKDGNLDSTWDQTSEKVPLKFQKLIN